MKRILGLLTMLTALATACTRPAYTYQPAARHDNGLHKGWYKRGPAGLPPGQAKKSGRYGPY